MGKTATLRFADGAERTVDVEGGATVLSAALESGINLLHQCRSGSCGTCVGRLVSGEVSALAGRASCLLPGEFESGLRLACLSLPAGETHWEFDYPSVMLDGPVPLRLDAKVTELKWLSASVAELQLRLPKGSGFSFEAGQYVRLHVPGAEVSRCISMASPSQDLPILKFLVRHIPGGVLSDYLRERCRPGDVVEVEGPFGSFVASVEARPHVLVAGGTGLAPVLSILDSLRLTGAARHPVHLFFGVSREEDLFYLDELELREFWMPTLKVRVSVDQAEASPGKFSRALHAGSVVSMLEGIAPLAGAAAYLCGPPGMIAAASARLAQSGFAPDQIITERFSPS